MVVAEVKSNEQKGLPPFHARLTGRIRAVRRSRGQRRGWLYVVVLPAPDEFTAPATVEVFSEQRVGEVGEALSCVVRIGGYARAYQATDDNGEKFTVQTADNVLQVVP